MVQDGQMKTFIALVDQDEGSAYGVSFPDLPGCFSAADNLDDVISMATEALQLWFEDEQETAPSSIHASRMTVADRLSSGAFLVAVPLLYPPR